MNDDVMYDLFIIYKRFVLLSSNSFYLVPVLRYTIHLLIFWQGVGNLIHTETRTVKINAKNRKIEKNIQTFYIKTS